MSASINYGRHVGRQNFIMIQTDLTYNYVKLHEPRDSVNGIHEPSFEYSWPTSHIKNVLSHIIQNCSLNVLSTFFLHRFKGCWFNFSSAVDTVNRSSLSLQTQLGPRPDSVCQTSLFLNTFRGSVEVIV